MAYTPKKSPQPASSKSNGSSDKRVVKKESSNDLLNTPIKFNDAEVKRMHLELDKREKASKSNSPRNSNINKSSSSSSTTATNKNKKNSSSSTVTFKSFLLRVAIFYFLIAFYIVCPRDLNQSKSICRNLNSLQKTLKSYEHYTKPINPLIDQVTSKLNPYYQEVQLKVTPYIEQVKPYYNQATTFLTPHLETSIEFYNSQVEPRFYQLLEFIQIQSKPLIAEGYKHYQSTLAPSVEWYTNFIKEWYNQNIQRHYLLVQSTITTYYTKVYDYVSPLYYEGLPILQKHYTQTIKPITLSTYRTSKKTYVEQIHPRLLTGGSHALGFYKSTVLPGLQRFWSLYIAPQVDEIRGKIYEYRTKKLEIEVEKEVEVLKEVLKQEIEVDDLDEFIAELRVEEPVVESQPEAVVEAVAPVIPAEVLPTPEELLALTAAKRETLETLQTTYEKSIAKLGQVEHDLLVKRLSELRTNAALDIPKRFDSIVEDLDGEGDKMVGRLQKYFARVAEDEKLSVEEKVNDADFLAKKASAKVNKMREEILGEVEAYKVTLEGKEAEAVTKASEALSDLVAKAQEELGFGWTWLDDVRHSDWARYHKLSKAQSTWSEYHSGVASGSIKDDDLAKIANPIALLDDITSQINSLVESFETILAKITIKGQKELKGESLGVISEVQKVLEVVSDKVVEVVEVVKESASSVLDITTPPTPSTIPETLSSIVVVAQESITSVAQVVYEAIPEVPILESASSVLEEVTASVTSIIEEITSTVVEIFSAETTLSSSSSIEVVDSISSVIESVTSVIVNDLPESIASVYSVVEEVATSAVEQVIEVIIPATSTIEESTPTNIIESVSSVVESVVASVIENITTTSSATASHPTDEGFASSVSSVAESIHSNAASIIEEVREKLNVVVHEEL